MRAALYETFGEPSTVLKTGDRPMPEPGAGQVRVKMTRAAIHNHDLWTIRGSYGVRPPLPAIGGSEGAGLVDALGEGVTDLAVGQRVCGFAIAGAWAEYFVCAAPLPLPDAISDELGCQLVAMPLSAMTLLEHYKVEPGEWLVQNAANGAVGKTLATIAKARGIQVVHLVRSEGAVRELEALGIPGAISTADAAWRDKVRSVVGEARIACAIDALGGAASGDLCALLGTGGTFVAFGSMTGLPMQIDSGSLIFNQIKAEGFWLLKVPATETARRVGELVKLVVTGALQLPVASVHDLEHAAEATAASVKASRHGKVLLRP